MDVFFSQYKAQNQKIWIKKSLNPLVPGSTKRSHKLNKPAAESSDLNALLENYIKP